MKKMYMSIAAQHDNLGDIIIRRRIVRVFEERDYHLAIFAGDMPKDYIEAFGFGDKTIIFSNIFMFQISLLLSCLKSHTAFVLAPGPVLLDDTIRRVLKRVIVVFSLAFVRIMGGQVFNFGRSLRGKGRVLRALERVIFRISRGYTVRDDKSQSLIGEIVEFIPDIGLLEHGVIGDGERRNILFSLRYDRNFEVESLRPLVLECRRRGFIPIFVSQVKRDDEQHKFLASELGAQLLAWGDKSHALQLLEIEHAYANSHSVISNRLHALILGIVAGGFPVSCDFSDKIPSTLHRWFPSMSLPGDINNVDMTILSYGESERSNLKVDLLKARTVILSSFDKI